MGSHNIWDNKEYGPLSRIIVEVAMNQTVRFSGNFSHIRDSSLFIITGGGNVRICVKIVRNRGGILP